MGQVSDYAAGLAGLPARGLVVFGGVLIVLVFFYVSARQSKQDGIARVPGPWMNKWTDLPLTYNLLTAQKPQYIHRLHLKYGPVVRVGTNEVYFDDVSAKSQIYGINKVPYVKSPVYHTITMAVAPSVFSTADVELHKRHRRLLSPQLSEAAMQSVFSLLDERVTMALKRMRQETEIRGSADLYKWWMFMAADVIGELTFGESFNMLESQKKNQYILDIENAGIASAIRMTFPIVLKLLQFLPFKSRFRLLQSKNNTMAHADKMLKKLRQRLSSDPDSIKFSLFSKVAITQQDEKSEEWNMSWEELRSNAQAYIVGGADPITNTMTYLIWNVCKHPAVKAALLEELATLPPVFNDLHLNKLRYMNQVIEETLRVFSPVSNGLPRVVPPGGATIAGYWLEEGTIVSCQAYTLHRNPLVFPNPEVWDPSRWANPSKAMKDSIMTFGAGSRHCIGVNLARVELRVATARFFQEFPNVCASNSEGMSDDDMIMMAYALQSPKGHRCLVECN